MSVGDEVELVERVYPKLTVSHVMRVYSDPEMAESELMELVGCGPLADCWKDTIKKRIKTKKVPYEKGRLVGATSKFVKKNV